MNGFNNDTARTRDNIREGIIRYRKDTGQRPLKYSSLFQYIQNFSKLQNLIEPESELNILFIRKKDKIDFVLENYSLTTKRNYYNCIIVIMESHGEYFKEDKDLLNYYIIKRDELNEIYNKENKECKKETLCTKLEIDKMLNQIKKEIQGKELWKMDKILITNYDYQLIQFYIALSLQKVSVWSSNQSRSTSTGLRVCIISTILLCSGSVKSFLLLTSSSRDTCVGIFLYLSTKL